MDYDPAFQFCSNMLLLHHPQNHGCQKSRAYQHRYPFEDLLRSAAETAGHFGENQSAEYTGYYSGNYAQVNDIIVMGLSRPCQIAQNDSNNQGGFQNLAKRYYETG